MTKSMKFMAVACAAGGLILALALSGMLGADPLGISQGIQPEFFAAMALPAARDIVSLRQSRATAYAALEALGITGEQKDIDAAAADVEAHDKAIENADRLQKLKGGTAAPGIDIEKAKGFMAKYANLPASAHVVPEGKTLSPAANAAFGDMLMAVRRQALTSTADPLLIQASTGASEAIGEDGGFLVEKQIADGLLRRAFAQAQIADKVRRIPIGAGKNGLKMNALKDHDRRTGSRWGGIQIYHIGEGESLTPTRPKFRQMNLQLKKAAGLMYATDEMLQDAVALAGVISEAYPEELAFVLDDVVFEGAGGATGLGFMNSPSKVTVAKKTGQAARTILFENVTEMFARLPASSIPRSEWWVNQDTQPALMALHQVIGTGGVPVYLPPGGLSASPYGTLLGRPVKPIEQANTLGTEGDICLADPYQYVMIDKGDIQYATSIHVAFLTAEQAFRFIYRYDGQPIDDKPITPFKGAATQSPFVTLATRA